MTDTPQTQTVPLAEALGERYLSYALSTITARSLPDVRDGMKPVHRRLLYAMSQLRLGSDTPPKKAARVVGDVIGKFHPHGEASVYDTLVRFAQDFAVRYPMVDGQGNFGNIDGDNPAAMRYTEARLTAVAEAMLDGIDEDAVDLRPTYDGDGMEPVVLPAAFPNLLANGAQGIAVGMATNIPPHNVDELAEALLHLIDHPEADDATLAGFLQGPDFPTGGVLVEPRDSIVEAYRTGRGSFRLRARWTTEKLGQGLYQVVVTEIPYQVQKSRLIERIAELINERKQPLLADVRDESTDVVRMVLEPRSRNVDADQLMEQLFRQTDLEVRIGLNLNVLDASGVPRVMALGEVLRAFLTHRREVLRRRTEFRLRHIAARLELLAGYLIAYLNLDEVIRIIREEDDPKAEMMARFGLNAVQADAVLNMRLRALRKLEELEIRREHEALGQEQADLQDLLAKEARIRKVLAYQMRDLRKRFGAATPLGRRRTSVAEAPAVAPVPLAALVEREPVTVFLSEKGWIRTQRGHLDAGAEVKHKEGDRGRFMLHAETTDRLLLIATNGRFFTLPVDKLPRGRGFGEPLRLMVDLGNDADLVQVLVHDPARRLLIASTDGRGFVVPEGEVAAQTRAGRQVQNLEAGAETRACVPAAGDTVAVLGTSRKLLCFPLSEVPEMARGRGVILQRYTDGALTDVKAFRAADGLSWPMGDRTRTESDLRPWMGKRGSTGRLVPRGFPKGDRFA